ncbi:MAG: hypothetical protein ABIW76_21435 [Fibrobacteria bacterium]
MDFKIRGRHPIRLKAHAYALLMFTGILGMIPALAQEPSIIIKTLDALEKRIIKVESEMGKLKKVQGAKPLAEKIASGSDSVLPGFSMRLDSMLVRLNALEAAAKPKAAPSTLALPSPAATPSLHLAPLDSSRSSEITSLVREVKEMIEILKQGPTPLKAGPAASLSTVETAKSSLAPPPPMPVTGLEIKGDVQIQGERKFTSAASRNNLDDFWGRLNFGAEYNSADFQSKINIRIFPEGFGFEPLTGATFDTTGQGSLKLQTQPSSRVVVNNAWVKYSAGTYRIKFGRFETLETQSSNFGNYVDLGTGGKFLSRPAVHNALELSAVRGKFSGSALLGTNDSKLNRGFLRLYEKYAFSPKLQASVGYRANIFDRFKYQDQEILQRYDLNLALGLPRKWKAFAEAALLQAGGKDDERPLLLGIQPFTGKALDLLSLETEYVPDRQVAKKDKEWLLNLHVRKIFGRLKLESSLSSDLADPAWNAYSLGLRITSNIK